MAGCGGSGHRDLRGSGGWELAAILSPDGVGGQVPWGGGLVVGKLGPHLLRQPAQEHTQQQLRCHLGGGVRPQGHDVVHEDRRLLNTKRRKVKQVVDLLLLSAAISPAEALFKLLVRIVECREIVHDILNAGHRLLRELPHAVMVFRERGRDVPDREGALTHVEPCVRSLQPKVGQV